MADVDLGYAFGLAPEKAVEYFRAKGYAISWDWWDTWQEAHAKAFTVAKVTRMDLLQDMRAAVDKAIAEGQTYEEFRRGFEPMLKSYGWWGRQKVTNPQGEEEEVQLGSPWRMKTIYRTNMQVALSAGRWRDFIANAENRPYLQIVCVLDAHTRPSHRRLHLKVFRIDDPFWQHFYPPFDWGCRCRVRALSQEDVDSRGLKVESAKDCLSQEDALVSQKTGELRPVSVYTDPKTGARVKTGPGWDYNPGLEGYEPDLSKYDPDILAQYQEAKQAEGLARRFPIKKNADLAPLLRALDQENPGLFQKGFNLVEISSSKKFLMAASRDGDIVISSATSPSGFNAARELRSAFSKIGKGEALSFNEEYAVEALWHEIGHCRSQGWVPQDGRPKFVTVLMETLNQWVARKTYGEFLELLGGSAAHQAEILDKGIGYATFIRNFRTVLREAGLDEDLALGALRPLSVEASWSDLPTLIPEKLAGLLARPELADRFRRCLALLDTLNGPMFESMVRKILGAI